jgi:hypothetical protein
MGLLKGAIIAAGIIPLVLKARIVRLQMCLPGLLPPDTDSNWSQLSTIFPKEVTFGCLNKFARSLDYPFACVLLGKLHRSLAVCKSQSAVSWQHEPFSVNGWLVLVVAGKILVGCGGVSNSQQAWKLKQMTPNTV